MSPKKYLNKARFKFIRISANLQHYFRNELLFMFVAYRFPKNLVNAAVLTFQQMVVTFLGETNKVMLNPFRKIFHIWRINTNQIEIELTTKCNMHCYQCNRSCRQMPSNEHISLEQLEYFIEQSIAYRKKWRCIRVLGGEPTLHPQIFDACSMLIKYKNLHSPFTKITIITNGAGKKVKEVLSTLPEIIFIENSNKKQDLHTDFSTYNVAPVDMEKYNKAEINFSKGCCILTYSGLALTRYGYYACGPGASIDRIMNLNLAISDIKGLTRKNLKRQLGAMCKYCGHFKAQSEEIYAHEYISPTWATAYSEFNGTTIPLFEKKTQPDRQNKIINNHSAPKTPTVFTNLNR